MNKRLLILSAACLMGTTTLQAQKALSFEVEGLKIRLDNRLTMDAAAYVTDNSIDDLLFDGLPFKLSSGVNLTQIRTGAVASLGDKWTAKIDLNFSNRQVTPCDIYLQYAFNTHTRVMLGYYKDAFSLEALTASKFLSIHTPMAVDFLTQGQRYLGATLTHWQEKFYLSGGFYASSLGDTGVNRGSDGIGVSTRNLYTPMNNEHNTLLFGLSYRFRTTEGVAGNMHPLLFSTLPESSIDGHRFNTALIERASNYHLLGFEAAYRNDKFYIAGEAMINRINSFQGPESFSGAYLTASYMLRGNQRIYLPGDAMFTPTARVSKGGNIELIGRLSYLDATTGYPSFNRTGGTASSGLIGINYYPNGNLLFALNYTYTHLSDEANQLGLINKGVQSHYGGIGLHTIQLRTQILF